MLVIQAVNAARVKTSAPASGRLLSRIATRPSVDPAGSTQAPLSVLKRDQPGWQVNWTAEATTVPGTGDRLSIWTVRVPPPAG